MKEFVIWFNLYVDVIFWAPVVFFSFLGSIVRFMMFTKNVKTLSTLCGECLTGIFVATMIALFGLEYTISIKLIYIASCIAGLTGLEMLNLIKGTALLVVKKRLNGYTQTTVNLPEEQNENKKEGLK